MAQKSRELSQFSSFLEVDNSNKNIGITTGSTPNIGIGTTNPIKKVHIVGDTLTEGNSSVVGYVSATSYYLNGSPLTNAIFETWTTDGPNVYRLNGSVGIGISNITQRLTVLGNISAGQFISTITSGTAPFSIQSETLVPNLNSDYLRGGVPGQNINDYDILTRAGIQTVSNKTLISPIITSIQVGVGSVQTLPTGIGSIISTNSVGLVTTGMIANNTIVNEDISTGAGITYGKLSLSNSILNSDISTGAGITYGKLTLSNSILNSDIVIGTIANNRLQNSTISGVSLGSTLGTLTFGNYLQASGTSYNGSTNVSIAISASTNSNADTVVVRDSFGNFSANTITANLTGNATGLSGTPNLNVGIVTATTINAGIITGTTINDSSGNVRKIPQNSRSTTYTLAITDIGKHINISAGAGVTVPSNTFSSGDAISIFNNTGTAKTVFIGAGVTMILAGSASTGTRYLSQYALATVICISSNVFAISGAGVT